MFSGIIESLGTIREFVHGQESAAMVVETKTNFSRLDEGESIAVNGVCLTVIEWDDTTAAFDVIDETLNKTNLVGIQPGTLVNLERAARFGDEIGGHPLSGHIMSRILGETGDADVHTAPPIDIREPHARAVDSIETKGHTASDHIDEHAKHNRLVAPRPTVVAE